MVFLTTLAVARMVIWVTRKKGLYDDANFPHRDLVLYQLRIKISCNSSCSQNGDLGDAKEGIV